MRKKRSSDGSRPVMKTYAGGATTVGKDEYLMSSSIEEKNQHRLKIIYYRVKTVPRPETRMPSTAMNLAMLHNYLCIKGLKEYLVPRQGCRVQR